MRISDWSSDVCSSDLLLRRVPCRRSRQHHEHQAQSPLAHGSPPRKTRPRNKETAIASRSRTRPATTNADGVSKCADRCTHRQRDTGRRSEEHTSELQSLMRISYAVFCLKKKNKQNKNTTHIQ